MARDPSPFLEEARSSRDGHAQRALVRALEQPASRAVSLLCPLLFVSEIDALAGKALAHCAAQLRALEWKNVERNRVAQWFVGVPNEWMAAWNTINPRAVLRGGSAELEFWQACALTKHHSGYVREAAILRLGDSRDPRVLPWLLLRLNDWVIPVRVAAGRALTSWSSLEHHEKWVRLFPLVRSLEDVGRSKHADFIARIEQLLLQRLEGLLISVQPDPSASRAAAMLLLKAPDASVHRFCDQLAAHPDPIVRRAVLLRMRGADDLAFDGLLSRVKRDRDPRVRDLLLDILVERQSAHALGALEDALADRSARVRATARFYLNKHSPRDFRAEALERLSAAGAKASAADVFALRDVAKAEDVARFAALLDAPSRKVRCAAVDAVSSLAPDRYIDRLWILVLGEDHNLARRATDGLLKAGNVDEAKVEQLLSGQEWRRSIRFLNELPPWRRAIAWLHVLERDNATATEVADNLAAWCVRIGMIGVRAQPSDIHECRATIARAKGLPADLLSRLDLVLRDEERLIRR